jgi:hypothetical protein
VNWEWGIVKFKMTLGCKSVGFFYSQPVPTPMTALDFSQIIVRQRLALLMLTSDQPDVGIFLKKASDFFTLWPFFSIERPNVF